MKDIPINDVIAIARDFVEHRRWLNAEQLRTVMARLADELDPPLPELGEAREEPKVNERPKHEPTHTGHVLALEKGGEDLHAKLAQAGDGTSWIDEEGHVYEGRYGYEATGRELRLDLGTVALLEPTPKTRKRKSA